MSEKKPRLRVCALIVRAGQVALVEFFTPEAGVHYDLPSGGLDPGESLHDGLRRECREEIGCAVTVGHLLMVAEHFPPWGHWAPHDGVHTIDFVFECTLVEGQEPHMSATPDEDQTGAQWMPISALPQTYLRPEVADWLVTRANSASADLWQGDAWANC